MGDWHVPGEQVVTISPRAVSFTAICEECVHVADNGWHGTSFGGTLDLDLQRGTFLCRRGHRLRVERSAPLEHRGIAAA